MVVDTLSRRHTLFSKLGAQILGFDHILEMYIQDSEFFSTYVKCIEKPQGGFYVNEDICLKKEKFVFPKLHKENFLCKKHMKGDWWLTLG